MIYIVTYATHDERYLPILKESCPELVILGQGKKWKGGYDKVCAMTDFCRTKKDDDVLCFVDGFDCICLGNDCEQELLKKFISMNCDLVISKTANPANVLEKFTIDKLFGSCNGERLNSGMYIGYPKSLIAYWENIKLGDDDQRFATKQCSRGGSDNIKIDLKNQLFYNYSTIDNITFPKEGRISIGDSLPCIMQAPGMFDIKHILLKLGYNNIPDVKFDLADRFNTYKNMFLLEFSYIIFLIPLFIFVKNKYLALFIALIVFLEMVHYELYVKHVDAFLINKVAFMILDTIHVLFISLLTYSIFYTFTHFNCNLRNLFLMNLLFIFFFLLFMIFKMCVLTIIENTILGVDLKNRTFSHVNRLRYFFDTDFKYNIQNGDNAISWINGNIPIFVAVFILNLYNIYKIKTSKNKTCKKLFSI
jgi:hypothetical protein